MAQRQGRNIFPIAVPALKRRNSNALGRIRRAGEKKQGDSWQCREREEEREEDSGFLKDESEPGASEDIWHGSRTLV